MGEKKYEYKQIRVTDLLLNTSNPRFNSVKQQTETILAMVEDQNEKLAVLAEHINKNGLNPTDIIIVCRHGKQWLVREGNRRVTALKLANEPDLVPEQYPKLKSKFRRLNELMDRTILENVPCVVIDDDELANEWIRLKHTGENEGAGTVRWDGQQTGRFNNQTSGASDQRMVFLDALKELEEIPDKYKVNFANIKKTNFDRLMGDPDVRNLVGVEIADGRFALANGVNAYLLELLYDLAFTELSVGDIYKKEDRKEYISSIIERVKRKREKTSTAQESGGDYQDSHNEVESDKKDRSQSAAEKKSDSTDARVQVDKIQQPTPPKKNKGKGYPIDRKKLVPAQHKLIIDQGGIAKIFQELKTLDLNDYPNAVAVLFRVFIELSADHYIFKKELPSVSANSSLAKKIDAIAEDLEANEVMTKNELRAAKQMVSSDTQTNSVKTFNTYVHNKDVTPSSTDLKSAWDDLWVFITKIWG